MKKVMQAFHSSRLRDQRGVTIILVAMLMFVFLGITALAVDLSNLYVVRNELQNAADAGALAGARFLYNYDGTEVNAGTNQIAYEGATANKALAMTGAVAVDVNWASGQNDAANVDVQRGHWAFSTRTFTANASLEPVDLWNVSDEQLDSNADFINAVKVVARRQATPAASFFAQIFGYHNFQLSAEAVAYIGFAGYLRPEDVDEPIAICKQSIIDSDGDYTCTTGRMIDSGGGATHNSAAWTNFSQPCQTATPPTVRPLICSDGNPNAIIFGEGMGSVGGMQNNVYNRLRDCWMNAGLSNDSRGYPTKPWSLTLPVIDCPGNNPGPCSEIVGTVSLDVLWIKQSNSDPHWTDIPLKMETVTETWECPVWVAAGRPSNINSLTETQRHQCWQNFADNFQLKTADGTSVGKT